MIAERVGQRVAVGLIAAAVLLAAAHWLSEAERPVRASQVPSATPSAAPRSPDVLASLQGPGVTLIYLAPDLLELPHAAAPVV